MHKNFIFDLYGTLIHIHTDENDMFLWQKMAEIYSAYGAEYDGYGLKEAYARICREEEENILQKTGCAFAEIDLAKVFQRLLKEAPAKHRTKHRITAWGEWTAGIANAFRTISRRSFGLYPNTVPVLQDLQDHGCGIYLLSNAQTLFARPEMEMCGLTPFFDGIFYSSDHGVRKPDPLFLQELLQRYGLNREECVLIGNDFETDIASAMHAGMDSVYLNTYHYPAAEAERRFSEVRMNEAYDVRMILSGDIAELRRGER